MTKRLLQKTDFFALGWVLTVITLVVVAFAVTNVFASSAITTQLEPGDSGVQVSALQQFLAVDGSVYPEGLVTGYYGDLTTAAVQRYQCKEGIVCQGDVATTGYGRVGPATLAKIAMQQGNLPGGGMTLPPISYPPTGGDVWAPVLSVPTVTTSSASATIHWTTSEPARSRVMYGTAWPFLYASAPSALDPTFDASSDVTLVGLTPNTKYYYVLESVDASGNLQWGINHSFTTNL
ncbi:peptidoglycan-binding protein [Candidatus Kaiserbacteria bacterium]|nr:peptidoglycan-binding protein [Candidatus Kaiserbacteria bacterium]